LSFPISYNSVAQSDGKIVVVVVVSKIHLDGLITADINKVFTCCGMPAITARVSVFLCRR
jgi:hypothetical protein